MHANTNSQGQRRLENRDCSSRRAIIAGGALIVWLASIIVCLQALSGYERSPGLIGKSLRLWPSTSALVHVKSDFTLVMFVHPQCPCTHASLEELNVIMTSEQARHAMAYVAFIKLSGTNDQWIHTYSWGRASEIPNVTRCVDYEGREAHRFGAKTSGDLFLYDPSGHLEFAGGITSARGEEGDNTGRQAVLGLLAGESVRWQDHAVFGCALFDSSPASASANQDTKP